MDKHPTPRTVLVTGANGYIGSAVSRSFARAGWKTYGLIRSQKHASTLSSNDIIPVLGSFDDPSFSFLTKLNEGGVVFDVVISTTGQISNYIPHYNAIIPLLHKVLELTKDSDKLATSPGLRPHTEESLLNPPKALRDRANSAMRVFHHGDAFNAAVIRPTNVYGFSSSYYMGFFVKAQEAQTKGCLEFREDPETILHALHVDDCGDAYVALAETGLMRIEARYETLGEIAEALAKEYGIKNVKCESSWTERECVDENLSRMLFGFSQWTGSERLRALIGWKDKRLLFSQGSKKYRSEFEKAAAGGDPAIEGVLKMW